MKIDNAAQKIEAFEMAVDTLVKHDEMLRGHIDLMLSLIHISTRIVKSVKPLVH